MTLTEFLSARIAEDEAAAHGAQETGDGWWHDGDGEVWSHVQLVSHPTMVCHAEHIARHDPVRVLAECEVLRRIVERHRASGTPSNFCLHCAYTKHETWPCPDLLDLGMIYADHPDFRDEWKP